jgi:ParB-like chromosome segregation protein Spo0J
MDMLRSLKIAQIRRDFQSEEHLLLEIIEEYVSIMKARGAVEPVTVCFDGKEYWLKDGFHRMAAAEKLGRKTIRAEVIRGTYAEMQAEFEEALAAIRADLRRNPQ